MTITYYMMIGLCIVQVIQRTRLSQTKIHEMNRLMNRLLRYFAKRRNTRPRCIRSRLYQFTFEMIWRLRIDFPHTFYWVSPIIEEEVVVPQPRPGRLIYIDTRNREDANPNEASHSEDTIEMDHWISYPRRSLNLHHIHFLHEYHHYYHHHHMYTCGNPQEAMLSDSDSDDEMPELVD